jgi:hypothetical protein
MNSHQPVVTATGTGDCLEVRPADYGATNDALAEEDRWSAGSPVCTGDRGLIA